MSAKYVASVLLVLIFAGCGSGEENPAPPDSPTPESKPAGPTVTAAANVCGLASDAEIGALVGNDVGGVDVDATLCEYAPTSGTLGRDRIAVDVFRNEASGPDCAIEFGGVSASKGEPVDGLGDVAYWRGDRASPQLYICGAGSFVAITLYAPASTPAGTSASMAREIGSLVLGRL